MNFFDCLHSQDSTTINWSTWDIWHTGGSDPGGSTIKLKGLDANGANPSDLVADATQDTTYNGDLIELGFFKDLGADGVEGGGDDSASTVMFKGKWTPLTSKSTIGQNSRINTGDWTGANMVTYTIPAGEFDFTTLFQNDSGGGSQSQTAIHYVDSQTHDSVSDSTNFSINDPAPNLGDDSDANSNLNLLDASTGALLGIRFYDISPTSNTGGLSASNGTTRYNTIMDSNWQWVERGSSSVSMSLHNSNGTVNENVKFEFTNSQYNAVSDIGKSAANGVGDNNYTATVTYYSGAGTLDLTDGASGIGDTVLSGLESTGDGALNVGNSNILTIHSNSGSAYDFNGSISASGGGAGLGSILKTGSGEQILTGAINLAGSSSGFVDIYEGNLTFRPDTADTQSIEFLKSTDDSDAGTTPILKLDNTTVGTNEILEIGLTNVSSAQTFAGDVVLSGANSAHKIKVGTTDYSKEQIVTGTINSGHNSMTLVKDGAGKLTLHGDSASTMGAGITIDNGTLVVGDGSDGGADPGSGSITINKGKLEVAANEAIDNSIGGGSDNTKKSVVGGDGAIASLTVGSANGEVDVISPGAGISSSLSETANLSNQQVTLGTSSAAAAMGDLTILNLTLNDGAIFDWEIADFNGAAGTGHDVLRFSTLSFDGAGTSGLLNIFSVASNGSAGAAANLTTHSGSQGILFLDKSVNDNSNINWNGHHDGSAGYIDWFAVDDRAFNYHNGNLMGDWAVWYNGSGDFYLRYTAAPEPSTYIMVTGLLMLPGFRMFRRFIKKAKSEDSEAEV